MKKTLLFFELKSKVNLSDQEIEDILSGFQSIHLKKKETLIHSYKLNDKVFFIEKGLLYSYKVFDNRDNQVVQFGKEGNWISDLYSFFSGNQALFAIDTIEESELLFITRKQYDELCDRFQKVERYFRINFQKAYANSLLRISDIYSQDTQTKYNLLIEKQFDLTQRVPQYLIASYLGVLPSSLSRLRSKKD